MRPRIGSLFSGTGALDMAVHEVLGATTAWFVEYEAAPSKILAHHWPDVPNYGDVTKVDWSRVEPVDIITGGSPCQDLSHAGKRAGMTDGTRSNLWVAMREAIAQLRPSLVVWENVRGAYSAPADSAVEFSGRLLGPSDGGPALRALGRVLGDLSDLGYDTVWHGLRAADVGAPHGRFRVFVVATDTQRGRRDGWSPDALGQPLGRVAAAGRGEVALLPTPTSSDTNGAGQHGDGGLDLRTAVSLLPTPRATDGTKGGPNQRGSSGDLMLPSAVTLLPTPACNDMGEGKTVEAWDEWTAKMQAAHGNGNGHGKSLAIEAQRLLPTPTTMDSRASGGNPNTTGTHGTTLTDATVRNPQDWGIYADAIARWETLTRPAPAPTQPSKKGTPQLSPQFSEWLMGLPAGHVTDVPGLSRNDMLKALGNGVVPQQAAAAIRWCLASAEVAA
jgi:DNA (cytosine-5)-methyltransferase 1